MTPEQWRAAWILCETAGDLDAEAQREYVRGATVDQEVERRVTAVFEQLESEPSYPKTPDRRAGETVGRYTLGDRIGAGGMGEVYAAEDAELRRTVALKFLPSAVAPDKAAASQVIGEARLASRLNHPNIVTVYEIIQTPWGLAMVMELVEGQSLRHLRNARQLRPREVIPIGRQVASALSAAHEQGIVHRDIKPENIMVRADGYVKVLDFGLAQSLRDRALNRPSAHLPVGTARYMAPEQRKGEPVTGASDIYSLAVLLEELGPWRHPLLTKMRSASPLERPSARVVTAQLERAERSLHAGLLFGLRAPLLAGILAVASLLLCLVAYRSHRTPSPSPVRFERITSYDPEHSVTVARLSPDGERLAYATTDGGLIVRNTTTSGVQELTPPPGFAAGALWFASDSRLLAAGVAQSDLQTWTIPLNGGPPQQLLSNTLLLALSHDRKQLAWLNRKHEIWTGSAAGSGARLLYPSQPDERIASLFWSANGHALWFNRLRRCALDLSLRGAPFNPDTCLESDLLSQTLEPGPPTVELRGIRLDSGFFADDGQLFFLHENSTGRSAAGFNLWSGSTNPRTGKLTGPPRPLSALEGVVLSQLSGSADGQRFAAVRTESTTQILVADWQTTPAPLLRNRRHLTLEADNSFPHAWTPDGKAVIFESDQNGHLELFRQSLDHREAELLVSAPGDLFMPQITPDGQWLLAMHQIGTKSAKGDARITRNLLRAPLAGGTPIPVPLAQPFDEFRCGALGRAHGCVLRCTTSQEQLYFELDPLTGVGRELGRSRFISIGLGRWSLSADGTSVVVPDPHSDGRFLTIHLDLDPAKRTESWRRIERIGPISGMVFTGTGENWLVSSPVLDRALNRELLPTFGDLFRAEGLFYVDAALHAHLIDQRPTNTFGVVSPDGKRIALLSADVTSNVWSLRRDGKP